MKSKILTLLLVFTFFAGVTNNANADKTPQENKQNDCIIGETETTGVLGVNNAFLLEEQDFSNDMINEEMTDKVIKKYESKLKDQPAK